MLIEYINFGAVELLIFNCDRQDLEQVLFEQYIVYSVNCENCNVQNVSYSIIRNTYIAAFVSLFIRPLVGPQLFYYPGHFITKTPTGAYEYGSLFHGYFQFATRM